MTADELTSKQWYWIRRNDGSLAPYRFHRLADEAEHRPADGQSAAIAEFFVGSFLQHFRLSQVVAEAQMPVGQAF